MSSSLFENGKVWGWKNEQTYYAALNIQYGPVYEFIDKYIHKNLHEIITYTKLIPVLESIFGQTFEECRWNDESIDIKRMDKLILEWYYQENTEILINKIKWVLNKDAKRRKYKKNLNYH